MSIVLEKNSYLEIYKHSHRNAFDLLEEAKILYNKELYARAYFLAFTALEEISKAMHSADIFTGYCDDSNFHKSFKDHIFKINNVRWAHKEASSYPYNLIWIGPSKDDFESILPNEPLWQKRQESLFVGADDNEICVPRNKVNKEDARGIIHITDTAIERIWEVTVYWGRQIGTKGFIK